MVRRQSGAHEPAPSPRPGRTGAALAGGADVLFERASKALAAGEAQWAAELADMVLALDHRTHEALMLKAEAVDELAYNMVTATGRNYLHTCAQELRAEAAAPAEDPAGRPRRRPAATGVVTDSAPRIRQTGPTQRTPPGACCSALVFGRGSVSGHSKWATIKHRKGAADKARGKLFAKLIRQVEVAAREGGGDLDANATLRTMYQKARDNSVPLDTIERAIKRGTGELEGCRTSRSPTRATHPAA